MKKLFIVVAIAAFFFSACSQKQGDASLLAVSERNKKTALAAIDGFNKHDVGMIYKDCAPGFTDYGNGTMQPMSNMDSLKINMKGFLEAMSDFKAENINALASGDTVVVTAQWSGTFEKEFMGVKPTKRSFKAPDADIYIFNKDGKITSHRSVQGEATYLHQLGILME